VAVLVGPSEDAAGQVGHADPVIEDEREGGGGDRVLRGDKVDDEVLGKYILANFDMRPKALIEELNLLRPIYLATAGYGHFGRKEFPWESTARAAKMADDLGAKAKSNGNGKAKTKGSAQPTA